MPSEHVYEMRMKNPAGTDIGRIRVLDGSSSWIVEFGVEGPNVGLYSVTVEKYMTVHMNLLGLLELALSGLDGKKKSFLYAGVPIGQLAIEG